jgi:hypothetical protein
LDPSGGTGVSVDEAMREIKAIENLISPYAYYSYDAERLLAALGELKGALNAMDKERIRRVMEGLSDIESVAAPYRGYGFVEEALEHSKRLLGILRKMVEA